MVKLMSVRHLTRVQVRSVDKIAIEHFGFSGLVLMENAGRGCADLLSNQRPSGLVGILCGKGNNGGDGFVIARHLALRGQDALIVLLTDPDSLQGDALANYLLAQECGLKIICFEKDDNMVEFLDIHLEGAEWLVDAMLGTGTTGSPREPLAAAIRWCNQQECRRLAVDLPSGLDCDSGEATEPTFQADLTATFVARKIGFDNPAAAQFLGEVSVLDIGVPDIVVQRAVR
jgi:NAD(P)H-hydrate epimerase